MNQERKQILEMLAEGKITADEAERLLDKIGDGDDAGTGISPASTAGSDRPSKLKYLCVYIDSTDGDKVNVRVPLALIGTGIKLAAVMPQDVSDKLADNGVDLSKLNGLDTDELYDALRDLKVDVDSSDGDTVRVCCE
jgi:hypothetical protein